MQTPKFLNVQDSFHTVLKSRVQEYFKDNKKAMTGNGKLFLKAFILLGGLILLYIWLVFFTPSAIPALVLCGILGMFTAAIGFNVMHDGAHGSFSRHPFVNQLAAFSLNVLGGSSFMWNVKHNVIHHAYTNVDGIDDDIDIKPWMRMSTTQKKHSWHKFQHLYFWVLYSFMYIIWIFFLDYQKYFKRKVGTVPLKKMKSKDHWVFWGFKVLHLVLFFLLPVYMVGF
ncbi:MAG: fatty acid desaturase family protein, partial [Chitinophagaceae bacterium]